MILYDQLKKRIEGFNDLNTNKQYLTHRIRKGSFWDNICFYLTVNDTIIFFKNIPLTPTMSEEQAKEFAASEILNYLIQTRLPIWEESLKSIKDDR